MIAKEMLKKVASDGQIRRNQAKKRGLRVINALLSLIPTQHGECGGFSVLPLMQQRSN